MSVRASGRSPALDGRTRLFAIVGDPVAQVGSPALFNGAFRRMGRNAVLVPLHVPPAGLGAVVGAFRATRNFDGLVVTVPHKIAALDCVDEIGPFARRSTAVNAIRKLAHGRLLGENFDGQGFVRGLARHGDCIAARRVLLIGAGGAGRAVAHAIAARHPAAIGIRDTDRARARTLIDDLAAHLPPGTAFEAPPDARGFELIVNCSPAGMRAQDRLPIELSDLSPRAVVADVVLEPDTTALLAAAEARGCAVSRGRDMLRGQVDLLLDFFGVRCGARAGTR